MPYSRATNIRAVFVWVMAAGLGARAAPPPNYAARRARLQAACGDAAIIVPGRNFAGQIGETQLKQDPNFWYLTGVESPFTILVMTPRRTALFLPDEFQFASGQYPTQDEGFRRARWNRPMGRLFPGPAAREATGIADLHRLDDFAKKLPELVEGFAVVYLPRDGYRQYAPPGLAAPASTAEQIADAIAARLPDKRIENVLPKLAKMRLIKDEMEIRALRRAAEISGVGMIEAMRAIRPGVTDRTIAGVMEQAWKREGSPRASFAPVVNSGEDAMHFFPLLSERYDVNRTMRAGEMVFIDYGAAEFAMYTSDICRTFPVTGRFTPEQRKYYEIVLEAQETAIAAMRPGVMMIDVIRKAAEVFRRHDLEQYENVARMGEDKVWGMMPS